MRHPFPGDGQRHRQPQVLGWIVALGKSIRIVAPDALVERMREEIHRLSEQYK
ncbi:MAG: WYL domain-containing protein [Clostridia bacterium]|nr:WYL domain-containing protein [Clostridia bacterium]